jgi:hypothetical protein
MFEFYFVQIGVLACTKVYLQIGTRVFDVKWYDCPKVFMCYQKMLPSMKVLGKKIQLLLRIWFKDVLCISVNAITPV